MPRAVGCGRGPCDRYLIVTSDGAGNLVPTLGIARDLRRDTPSAFTPKSAFPGGQVSEMVDMQTSARERVERPGSERVCATSSTSRGAITRRPEGKRGMIMSGPDDELPSGRRVIGLCQVDEMARFGPAVWSEQILSVSPASRQHCPTRDDMTPQVTEHSTTWTDFGRSQPIRFDTAELDLAVGKILEMNRVRSPRLQGGSG